MSKLSFRARALDPSKPMPIFLAEELPDLPEYSAINRAVPQMPSGMEKEEESEHHLQRAICTGLIIPTPEVFATDREFYDKSYPTNYKMPRQMIHMQPLGLEQDIPDYDMDSADEIWVNQQSRRLDLSAIKFEQMMDRLEKSSGQTVVTLNEAKALLKQDDEISIAVYDYWLNKRLKTQHPLILSVKTENRSGSATNNPYLAFRRRTEKMQTRKNRKNDETSYEKMLKLRRDLSRAVTLLEMVKRREKTKREQLHLSIEIFEKRYQARDFSGSVLSEFNSTNKRPVCAPIYSNQYSHHSSGSQSGSIVPGSGHYSTSQYLNTTLSSQSVGSGGIGLSNKRDLDGGGSRKEKRQYKKRKHKLQRDKQYAHLQSSSPAAIESNLESDEDDGLINSNHHHHHHHHHHSHHLLGSNLSGGNSGAGSDGEDEGLYAFRRNKHCEYHKPLTKGFGNWPWELEDNDNNHGVKDPKYRFTLTSIRYPRPRCIGFGRRRLGRGGRVLIDRVSTNLDDFWSQLDYTIFDNSSSSNNSSKLNNNYSNSNRQKQQQQQQPILPSQNELNLSSSTTLNTPTTITTTTTTTTPITTPTLIPKQQHKFNEFIHNKNNKFIKSEDDEYYLNNNCNNYDNENISRDPLYISTSMEPIDCPTIIKSNINNNNNNIWNNNHLNNYNFKTIKSNILNIYYQNKLNNCNNNNNIENNSISNKLITNYFRNKKIKSEDENHDGDGDSEIILNNDSNNINKINNNNDEINSNEWTVGSTTTTTTTTTTVTTATAAAAAVTTTANETNEIIVKNNQDEIVVDVMKNDDKILTTTTTATSSTTTTTTTIINNNTSNRNLCNNKSFSTNLTTTTSSDLNNLRTNNNNNNVIKDEIIIKEEPTTTTMMEDDDDDDDDTMSNSITTIDTEKNINDLLDDENVNLACLSNYLNASRRQLKQQQQLDAVQKSSSLFTSIKNNNTITIKNEEQDSKNQLISTSSSSSVTFNTEQQQQQEQTQIDVDTDYHGDDDEDNNQNNKDIDDTTFNCLDNEMNMNARMCNEFLNDIKNWLHFRPKTPPELELTTTLSDLSAAAVNFTETTPISIEMQRLRETASSSPPSSVFLNRNHNDSSNTKNSNNNNLNIINCDSNSNKNININNSGSRLSTNCLKDDHSIFNNNDHDVLFITNPFAYADLLPDEQLLNVVNMNNNNLSGINVAGDLSNSGGGGGVDINNSSSGGSGDSFNEFNLSIGENDDNEKMLDNILQECQIDDLKALNQTTNFWNGILDDGSGLLDAIDDKKSITLLDNSGGNASSNNNNNTINGVTITSSSSTSALDDKDGNKKSIGNIKKKLIQNHHLHNNQITRIGSSMFSITNESIENEKFFQKTQPLTVDLNQSIKIEPPDEIMASPPLASTSSNTTTQSTTIATIINKQNNNNQQNHKISILPPSNAAIVPIDTTPISNNISQLSFTNHNRIIGNASNNNNNNNLGSCTTAVAIVSSNPLVTSQSQHHQQQQHIHTIQTNALPQTIFANLNLTNQSGVSSIGSGGTIGIVGNQKFFIKQDASNQVPNQQQTQQQQQQSSQNAVITLTNVKLENDLQTATVVTRSSGTTTNLITTGGNILAENLGNSIISSSGNIMSVANQQGSLLVTSKQSQQQQQQQQQTQQQQHILWKPIGQGSQAQILNVSSGNLGDSQGGTIVLASSPPNKQQINGPTERNTIQNLLKQTKIMNRKLHITPDQLQQRQQQIQQLQHHQQQQQLQIKQEDESQNVVQNSRLPQQQSQQSQHLQQQSTNFIKMTPYPVVVTAESNAQQTQQQQQQNSLSAVAVANHNYSLQPSAQPITIIGQQQSGSKIILNATPTSGSGSTNNTSGNFTITTQTLQDMQNKMHYNKVNLVTNSGIQQASTGQQTTLGGSIIATHPSHQLQQQRIKLDKPINMYIDNEQKRVLYTKLVSLQQHKNNAAAAAAAAAATGNTNTSGNQQSTATTSTGQQQHQTLQITQSTAAQIIANSKAGGHTTLHRLGNSQAIVTNIRTLPVSSNQISIATAAGAGVNAVVTTGSSGGNNNNSSNTNDVSITSSTGVQQQQQHHHNITKQQQSNSTSNSNDTNASSTGGTGGGGINLNTINR